MEKEIDEKTKLGKYFDEEKILEDVKDTEMDINDALENAGCGLGTLFYTAGTFFFCCLFNAEIMILAVVGPILKCDWNLGSLSLSLLQMSANFGMMCSSGVTSPLGDKYGRRPMALIGSVGVTITGILCAFTKEYWQFLVLRLSMGVFLGLGIPAANVLSGEIPPKIFRALAMSEVSLAAGLGVAVSGAITYFVIDPYGWQGVVLGIPIAFSFASIIPLVFIRDSPRFDYYSGNVERAEKTIKQLYKLNRKGEVTIKLKEVGALKSEQDAGFRKTYNILERTDNLKNSVFINVLGFSSLFCYFFFAYIMPRLLNEGYCTKNSLEINDPCSYDKIALLDLEIINISELFSVIITLLLLERLGRRKAFIGAAVLGFLLPTALYLCLGNTYLLTFLVLTRASEASLALAPYLLVGEYMPTVIRSYMSSLVAMTMAMGAIIAILVAEYTFNYSPRVAIGVLQISATVPVMCLAMLKKRTGGSNLM